MFKYTLKNGENPHSLANDVKRHDEHIDFIATQVAEYFLINGQYAFSVNAFTFSTQNNRVTVVDYIYLHVGDEIFTDYENGQISVGWINSNNERKFSGSWTTSYTIGEEGNYLINFRYSNDADINDVTSGLIKIRRFSSENERFSDIKNQKTDYHIKSVSHRGFSRIAPENTLPAYKIAREMGYSYVEADVVLTSDNVPVLLHDLTINRTARVVRVDGGVKTYDEITGDIRVSDLTYAELQQYDFGVWKSAKFEGTKIPSLEEFMLLCRRLSLNPYLDLRGNVINNITGVLNIVKRCGMLKHTAFISAHYDVLTALVAAESKARVGFMAVPSENTISQYIALKTGSNEVFSSIGNQYITDDVVTILVNNDIELETWTPNYLSVIDNLNPYVTGVTSDYVQTGSYLFDKYRWFNNCAKHFDNLEHL